MQRSPAEPKPDATAASAVSSMSASGRTIIAFLAAGVGADPLAAPRCPLEDVAPDRGRADELDGPDVGVLDDGLHRLPAAVHDVERRRPGRRPRSTARPAAGSRRGCGRTA